MRFGVKFGVDLPTDPDELIALATRVENLGFHSLWVADHIVIPWTVDVSTHQEEARVKFGDKTKTDLLDPILTLTYLSTVTTHIRLGLSILVIPYRDPIITSKLLATLDLLSRGRLTVGAGIGWMREEFEALDVPYEERGAITDEYLSLMRELWTSKNPTFAGKYRSIANVAFLPKPLQKPHPPVWVGGNGVAAMRRAVKLGQGWMPNYLSPDELAPKLSRLSSILREAGRDGSTLALSVGCTLASDRSISPDGSGLGGSKAQLVESVSRYEELGVEELILLSPREPNLDIRLAPLERFASLMF